MRSRPPALSDAQLDELRQSASVLPVELRGALLELLAGYLELDDGELSDAAFTRALASAMDVLPAYGDEHRELERCHHV